MGRLLASRLGADFVDTDAEVERLAGKPISVIFSTDGEDAFRGVERDAVAIAVTACDGVLALGGGAVVSESTRRLLAAQTVVLLSVGLAEGSRRTGVSTVRPLLAGVNPRATFAALLEQRMPLYRQVACLEVDTDDRDVQQVVDYLVDRLTARG